MLIRAILFDIDGTLMTGNEPIQGADKAIRFLLENKIPYRFISNGTRKSRKNVLKKLEHLGIKIQIDEICTPALAAIQYLTQKKITTCNLLITDDLRDDFSNAGIIHDPKASTVIVGDAADRFTYGSMNSAFRSLFTGGELIALEKDRYWKDIDGLSLSAGPFVSALEYASGRKAIIMGKPSGDFFRYAMSGFDAEPSDIAMIGDDIISDVKGAQEAGLIGGITFTGKFKQEDMKNCTVTPDFTLNSIASLPQLFRTSDMLD